VKQEKPEPIPANLMLTTVNLDQQIKLQSILKLKAPKRKQQVLMPKRKRLRKRKQSSSSEEGTKLEQIKIPTYDTGIPGVPTINKKEWKHFKPWVEDE
jgi:hypothetical protein